MTERIWMLVEILDSARQYLTQKGVENARGSAEALLGKVVNLPRIELYLQHDRPLTAPQVTEFRELIRRRAQHEPLQLLLGRVEFLNCTLEVPPGLLIPRPETEELAAHVVERLQQQARPSLRLLDIGTGTGCLAVGIAQEIPGLQADAVDVDFEAVRCTTRNAERNGVSDRVHPILADLFAPRLLSLVQPPYDVVVSNPPYIPAAEIARLEAEVKDHEPHHALAGGQSGLIFFERIAALLPTLLAADGWVALEIGIGQREPVTAFLADVMQRMEVRNDLAGTPRQVWGYNVRTPSSNIAAS